MGINRNFLEMIVFLQADCFSPLISFFSLPLVEMHSSRSKTGFKAMFQL
uniref:Uncharacterized protein n=2 Tax=Anguilla anguilla TaxID=7936 RepID=A0A0E9SA28_ANGAN